MPYIISVLISFGVLVILSVNAWRRRSVIGGQSFSILMALCAFWLLGILLMVSRSSPTSALFWYRVQFISVVAMPISLIHFVTVFHGYDNWLTRQRILLMLLVPVLTLMFVWTDDRYHLFFQDITIMKTGELMLITSFTPAIWFHVHSAYSYLLSSAAIGWLIVRAIRQFALYRKQSIAIILGTLAVLIPNILFSFNLLPPDISILPFGFLIMGILVSWSIFNNSFLDVVPVGRNKLIDSMSDSMMMIDAQDRVVDINVAMYIFLKNANPDLAGLTSHELIGQHVDKILSPWQDLIEKYSEQENVQAEISFFVKGVPTYWDLRLSHVQSKDGRVLGRVIVLRDISGRVAIEQALRESKKAAETANRELARFNSELEGSNAELSAFSYTVAHDIKTPLGNIASFSKMLNTHDQQFSEEDVKGYLKIIQRESNKAIQIVNDLLLLARVRQQEDIHVTSLDMRLIVKEVLANLRETIANYQAEIIFPDQWPAPLGYGPWVEIVLSNYVSNALKYGGNPPVVQLGVHEEDANGQLRFWVRDNGSGLSASDQDRLFTPFTRLNESGAEGHGLGLTIVQRIVERLGGEVGLKSEEGAGATFYFTLPKAM